MSVNKRLISTGSIDVGFTTWTYNQQMTGAGGGNSRTLTYTHPFYILTGYGDATAYSNDGSSFSSVGITQNHGLYYAMGACLTDTALTTYPRFIVKGIEPLWPNASYWKEAEWRGSSMGAFTTISPAPPVVYGDLAFADVDGMGGYIYQVISEVSPNTTVRKYDPANLNSYTDITLASPLNNSANSSYSTLFFDGVGWWVVYMNGTVTWAAVKYSPDFQQLWVSEQSLGSFGGYQIGYLLNSSTLVGGNTVYLKADGTDKVQQYTLS